MFFDQARWRGPVPNESPGRMAHPVYGLVLHIEQGSEAGTDSWFHNPAAQASAHFGNPKTGPLDQWVDTADKAWAEVAGNGDWISVEHEGFSGDPLTPTQLENDAQLLAWLHQTDGVPLEVTDDPDGRGLGWHGMGGDAWGGHYQCPGQAILDQRQAILDRAAEILNGPQPPQPTQEDDSMYIFDGPTEAGGGIYVTDGDRAWGVPNEDYLSSFFFTGAMKHVGTLKSDAFYALRDRDGQVRSPGVGLEEGVLTVGATRVASLADLRELRESSAA